MCRGFWIYSDRRGVHCWICDERARKLNNDERKAIGGAQQH
ncbi:3104_t:CDS:2 [Diversispora eburnea]|uniref:3104_t:CDS:1 n=1 Tax=Diversispora eburnea TaxID=1213867 RepID=A0A9N9BGI1_9GLOM|nr:3104_t:CDS:2 [Diversispora eburnea]